MITKAVRVPCSQIDMMACIVRLIIMTFSISVIVACSPALMDSTVTTENARSISDMVKNNTSLSDVNKQEFASAMKRIWSNGYQAYGKTVQHIIEDQKQYEKEQEAIAHSLNNDIVIYPLSVTVKKGKNIIGSSVFDAPYEDIDELSFLIRNNGKKSIQSFDADATLSNKGNGIIFTGGVSDAEIIYPGKSIVVYIENKPNSLYDEGENARNTPVSQTIVSYKVTQITYTDGTKIDRSQLMQQ